MHFITSHQWFQLFTFSKNYGVLLCNSINEVEAQATGGCKHRIIYNSMVASDYSKLLEVATPSKYSYTNPITKVYHTFWRTFKNYSTVFFALTGNHRQNLEPIPSYTKEIRAISTPKSKVSFQPLHHDWPKLYEIIVFKPCLRFPWIIFLNNVYNFVYICYFFLYLNCFLFFFIEFWSIMMEGLKGHLCFWCGNGLIFFVYEGIGSNFCLWLPVSMKNTVE